jgi:flagellar basal-body rod modification protein FlgD
MQDFLQLLTVQLENQDPMNPMSDSDFFAQMAELGQVEGIDELNNSSEVQQAQSLMGKTVTCANTDTSTSSTEPTITGVVKTLSVKSGTYYLGIEQADGTITTEPLSSLEAVQQTPNIEDYENIIGGTVTGTVTSSSGTSSSVTGTVTAVSLVNNIPTLTVKESSGTTVSMPLSNVTAVAAS